MSSDHDTTTPTLEAPPGNPGSTPATASSTPSGQDRSRSGFAKKVVRIAAGTLVLLAGIAMLVLPGQGILTIAAGLAILAVDVPIAARLLRFVRRKTPGLSEEGSLPKSAIIMLVVMGVVFGAIGVWWQLQ